MVAEEILIKMLQVSTQLTTVKYQSGLPEANSVLTILENDENNGMDDIDLVTPTRHNGCLESLP